MIHIIGDQASVFTQFMAEVRDLDIQTDRLRFRQNMQRMGEIAAYEISKELNFSTKEVHTPLGISQVPVLDEKIVLATIMRAGLPVHQGLLNFFDTAENAFISSYRKYDKDGSFELKFEYISSPPLDDKVIILTDAMLATGASVELAYKALLEKGTPKHTHIFSVIACEDGIEHIRKRLPMKKITLWVGALDNEMTVRSYIVPGLGDAGDLAYGSKSRPDFDNDTDDDEEEEE